MTCYLLRQGERQTQTKSHIITNPVTWVVSHWTTDKQPELSLFVSLPLSLTLVLSLDSIPLSENVHQMDSGARERGQRETGSGSNEWEIVETSSSSQTGQNVKATQLDLPHQHSCKSSVWESQRDRERDKQLLETEPNWNYDTCWLCAAISETICHPALSD